VARFPADRDADYLLGNAAYRARDYDVALAAFGRCVRVDPRNAGAQYGLGLVSLRRREYEVARRAFEAALDADPRLERARERLAELPDPAQAHTGSEPDSAHRNGPSSDDDRSLFRLRVLAGPSTGRQITVDRSPAYIGRGGDADVQLRDDEDVSRRHAVLRLQGGEWRLEDAGSRNGTSLNGKRLNGDHSLRSGDAIVMGRSTLVVDLPAEDAITGVHPGTTSPHEAPVPDRHEMDEGPSPREQPPPYETTLKGPVVIGRVQDVQLRNEQKNRPLVAYSQKLETQNVLVLTFRVKGEDQRLVTVELRGLFIKGSHPRDGERVAVPERFRNGALSVRRFQNLETGEIVEAQDASPFAKGLYGARMIAMVVLVIAVLAFIAIIGSRVLPDVLEHI
jgi:pSer/pThr/pTyr-binding forkhead associated (FHA) protein